jgi:ribosomal protein S18 acetylase RimI-like enzyme
MTVRHATTEDFDALRELWDRRHAESPSPPPWRHVSWEANRPEFEQALDANALFLAEEDGESVGFVTAWLDDHFARIGDLHVADAGRRQGIARALVETVIENLRARGATHLFLEANLQELAFYERLGFREESRNLVLPLKLNPVAEGRSFGSIHVQSDDLGSVERAVQQFVPRLPGGSRGSSVTPPHNGWITVYDDASDRDPSVLRRLATELSERMGAVVIAIGVEHEQVVRFVLLEAGRIVDEYLSVPEHYGPLPPGDAIALAANPRVVSRLTGADPAAIRAAARTALSPAELPPAQELLDQIASAIGLDGAGHGWEGAA